MPLVDAAQSAIALVDVQPGFTAHDLMNEDDRERASATVDRIAWLLGLASLMEIAVVAVEEDPDSNGHTDERVAERLPAGTPTQVKDGYSFASSAAAVEALHNTRRKTVIVVGFETDVCVAQSALELLDLGFRVVACDDLSYTTNAYQHRHGMERMLHAGVEPNHLKGLVFEWFRTVERGDALYEEAVDKFGRPPLSG
jgi:nicotinamidase-related amidase